MTVLVLLFGHYRDGIPESDRQSGFLMQLPAGSTPADVAASLAAQNSAFTDLLQRTRIAVGAEFATPDAELAEGDEIAFLPPMSGG